jgi:hypothetical protein
MLTFFGTEARGSNITTTILDIFGHSIPWLDAYCNFKFSIQDLEI